MPPGHEPIPEACTSVPRTGSDGRPVKTTSRKTVPCTNRSKVSSIPLLGILVVPGGNVLHVRVTIVGGGGFRVPLIARQLAASGLPVRDLALYDTDASRLAVIRCVLAGHTGTAPLPVRATTSLDEALRGADFIFSALRAGGLDGRVRDERTALDLGVLGQETVGAGGLAGPARAVPAADAIARRIRELAPEAWVISMTNPAGIITETMARVL